MDQMDIGANGASKKRTDKTEQPAAPTIGSAETRERVLEALANRCATVDEVQEAVSKTAGSHVPAGVIATALDGLVGGGVIDVEKGRYTLAESGLSVLRTRRSLLLKELTAGAATLDELGTKCGIARAQVSIELAELGRRLWVRRCGDALSDTVALTDVGAAVLAAHAAVAAAASTLPTLAPPIEGLREKMAPIVINDASRRLVGVALASLVKAGEIDHGDEGGFRLCAPDSDSKKPKGRR